MNTLYDIQDSENDTGTWLNKTGNDPSNEVPLEAIFSGLRTFYLKDTYGEHYVAIFISQFTICILGYITNVLNVIVLSKTSLDNSMSIFLMVLSVSDLIYITTQFVHVVHYFSGFSMYLHFNWIIFFIVNTYFENSFMFVSNWLVAVIGIWRIMVIGWPLESRRLCNRFRAKLTIVLIFIFSFGLSSLIFGQFTYQSFEIKGDTFYDTKFSDFAKANDKLFLNVIWAVQLLKNLLPMIIMLLVTNGLVVILFWTRYQRKKVLKMVTSASVNHRITAMLMLLLVLYWLSNLPDTLLFLSADYPALQKRFRKATDILRPLSMSNTAVSFFIYYALGEDFRRRFNKIFCGPIGDHFRLSQISERVSESSTIRSKSFDGGFYI